MEKDKIIELQNKIIRRAAKLIFRKNSLSVLIAILKSEESAVTWKTKLHFSTPIVNAKPEVKASLYPRKLH